MLSIRNNKVTLNEKPIQNIEELPKFGKFKEVIIAFDDKYNGPKIKTKYLTCYDIFAFPNIEFDYRNIQIASYITYFYKNNSNQECNYKFEHVNLKEYVVPKCIKKISKLHIIDKKYDIIDEYAISIAKNVYIHYDISHWNICSDKRQNIIIYVNPSFIHNIPNILNMFTNIQSLEFIYVKNPRDNELLLSDIINYPRYDIAKLKISHNIDCKIENIFENFPNLEKLDVFYDVKEIEKNKDFIINETAITKLAVNCFITFGEELKNKKNAKRFKSIKRAY